MFVKISWIFISFSIFLAFKYHSLNLGFFTIALFILILLRDYGLFINIDFDKRIFPSCEVFYKEYTGNYKNIGYEFQKIMPIINKFKLNRDYFNCFGSYYDNPNITDPNKCRAIIGILMLRNNSQDNSLYQQQPEFLSYMQENNFKRGFISATLSLHTSFPNINMLSIFAAIYKVYGKFQQIMQNEDPVEYYELSNDDQICGSIEIYKPKTMEFYFPLKNKEIRRLHSGIQE
jgi:hypothetical protein